MISFNNFVGALLHGLTMSRTMSDGTSLKVANEYLKDDYLRSLPIPRMTLKQVDVEVNFDIGPVSPFEMLLKEPEISKNITHKIHQALVELPSSKEFKGSTVQNSSFIQEWERGLGTLVDTIQRILAAKVTDKNTLIHTLAIAIENFFYETHRRKPERGLLNGLLSAFSQTRTEQGSSVQTEMLRNWASEQVASAIDSVLPEDIGGISELPELNILVGGPELEGKKEESLHTAKLSFTSDDRKWVANIENGEKSYILSR